MDRLKVNIKKSQSMVRRAAPITIESSGYARLSQRLEKVCDKLRKSFDK